MLAEEIPLHGKICWLIEILLVTLPVFILLGAGYLVVKIGYLSSDISDHLNQFAVKFAVPVLLFRAVYLLDFQQAFEPAMLMVFYLSCFVCFVIAAVLARTWWKRMPGESVSIGFSAFFSNSVMLGIPIAERGFGDQVLTPVLGIVVFHAPVLYAFGMISMEFARRDGSSFSETIIKAMVSIFTNPLMIGILAGLAANLIDLQLPEFARAAVDMVADAAIPVALVALGAALTRYEMKSELGETSMVSFISLFVHPAIAFSVCHYLLNLDPVYVQAAVLVACMPPGMNGYVFASLYNRAVGTAASTVLLATAISVVTVSLWLSLLKAL